MCGAKRKRVELELVAHASARGFLAIAGKKAGRGAFFIKQQIGSSFYRLERRWHNLHRIIDRRRNRYFEHIEDEKTGKVVRHVDERLSDHIGRGSAKRRRR